MKRSALEIVEGYLSRLRLELAAVGTRDTEELIAEIRSLLVDAARDDPEVAAVEIERLGEPAELARSILAERGLDVSAGISSGVWWRLGFAAPIDLSIGLALPLAAAYPLYSLYAVAQLNEQSAASIVIVLVLALVVLAWPVYIWRPWRRGGQTLSPGMMITGIAVVRAPGFWRIVRIKELKEMGLAPRRHVKMAVVMTLIAIVLFLSVLLIVRDVGSL